MSWGDTVLEIAKNNPDVRVTDDANTHAMPPRKRQERTDSTGAQDDTGSVRRNKYNAKQVTLDGFKFDSKLEASEYARLSIEQMAGRIDGLRVHPSFELQAAFTDNTGRKHRAIHYEADFCYVQDGSIKVVDTKGVKTPVFRLKEKLFRAKYPDIELIIK
jgi:hypothetical protein